MAAGNPSLLKKTGGSDLLLQRARARRDNALGSPGPRLLGQTPMPHPFRMHHMRSSLIAIRGRRHMGRITPVLGGAHQSPAARVVQCSAAQRNAAQRSAPPFSAALSAGPPAHGSQTPRLIDRDGLSHTASPRAALNDAIHPSQQQAALPPPRAAPRCAPPRRRRS